MKNKLILLIAAVATLVAAGCVTRKVSTVTQSPDGSFTTNIVTQVNTNNLILDASILQGATATTVAILAPKADAKTIQALHDAETALDGVLNGSNPQTTQQVLDKLKAGGNPALTAEITSLIQSVSALEQNLLAKYGASVAGQITVAMAKAVDAGLVIGLNGR